MQTDVEPGRLLKKGHVVKIYSLLLIICALPSCVSVQSLAQSLPVPQGDEAHVLLRVIPPDATLVVREGEVKNGLWVPSAWKGAYQTAAEKGYAIFTLPAGKVLGLDQILLMPSKGESAVEYRACNGLKVLVFNTVPGTNLYLADVLTRNQAGSLAVQYGKDLADVRGHPEESGIADGQDWSDQPYQLVPSMQSCVDKVPEAVKTSRRVRKNR